MNYVDNPVTETERGALFRLGQIGLPTAAGALACHLLRLDHPFAWLVTVMAGADLFSLALNYRARDEFFDRLFLSGARWGLGLMGIWVCAVAMITLLGSHSGEQPVFALRDQMTAFSATMTAFFIGFNLAAWRST